MKSVPVFGIVIGILIVSITLFFIAPLFVDDSVDDVASVVIEEQAVEHPLAQHVLSGGPPKDGIPPIDDPVYVSVGEADNFLDGDDRVFVVEYGDVVHVYPQSILVWHEVVNDEIDGDLVSVTYCPLTGSVIGYHGDVGSLSVSTTYGTSGKLLNSNLVMYDRATDSYIPQILGSGISGALQDVSLDTFPIYWSTWDRVSSLYPSALVLSEDTGFVRNYNRDPYGSYAERGTYYDSDGTLFPLLHNDARLPDKKVVIGVRGEQPIAIVVSKVKEERVVMLDEYLLAAFYDEDLDTVRVFSSIYNDEKLHFSHNEIIVDQHGAVWSSSGESEQGSLDTVDSFDVMWFAWYAYFPDTLLVD